MRSLKEMELPIKAMRVTWCICESCGAMGPRFITGVRNDRTFLTRLRRECCQAGYSRSEGDGLGDTGRGD